MVWFPTESRRGALYVVVGFVLLANPFVVGALDIGDPDSYRYEPDEITFHENGTYDAPAGIAEIDPEVACFEGLPTRSCVLERAVHANGGVRYDGVPTNFVDSDYSYVHVWGAGFFEPVGEELGNGTVEYGLEPVARSEALQRVADPIEDVPPGARTAIETGEFRSSDPIEGTGELVTHDGRYYVVTAVSARRNSSERRSAVVFLQWALGIGGALLVLRGQRLRVAGTG